MNKKGAELSMNVIIISILVILVLVIVAAFFMFGMTGLSQKIQDIFRIGTAGTDLTLAQQSCEQYCAQAKSLNEDNVGRSAYCTETFSISKDGVVEKDANDDPVKYYCYKGDNTLNVQCIGNSGNQIKC